MVREPARFVNALNNTNSLEWFYICHVDLDHRNAAGPNQEHLRTLRLREKYKHAAGQ